MSQPSRPPAPVLVKAAAAAIAALAALNIVRVAVQVPMNLSTGTYSPVAKVVFVGLNMFTVLLSAFVLLLAHQVSRGRMWAWVTSMVVFGIAAFAGTLLLAPQLIMGDFPWIGIVVQVPSLAVLLMLTVPRQVRRFFRPARSAPPQPWPGSVPNDAGHTSPIR